MRTTTWWGRIVPLFALLCLTAAAFCAGVLTTVLPNGLTVLIKEVHAAPVVVVDAWYKVGSRNEHAGITGASHLLEHMTYRGTTEFGTQEMKTLIRRNGAIDNGETYFDFTHYFTTIASDRVELPLRIEASRMHAALIRQQDLNREMTVVRSELEGYENNPGSQLFNAQMAAAFESAPYHWPVVGWRADVEHTTAQQLQYYYHEYYMPNNATLVIVGDVDTKRIMALVHQHFDQIARGSAPPQWVTPELPQHGERRVTLRLQGDVPMENILWHIPAITAPDIPAFMLLEQILGSGRTARLYQQIVEKKLAVDTWADALLLRDSSVFLLGAELPPAGNTSPVEDALRAEVARLQTAPPTPDEMARALRQVDASLIFARDSVTEQAEQLGYYQTVTGDWRFLDRLPDRLRAVTPADIARVAKTYLTMDNDTVGIFQPTPGSGPVAQTAASPASLQGVELAGQITEPTPGVHAARPVPLKTPIMPPAHRARFQLPNGVVLIVQENHANATVAFSASLKAGHSYDPAGKASLAELTADLLDHGTTTRSSNAIARELEGAASEITSGTGWETVGLRGKALSGDTALLLRNLADILRNPTFPTDELEKVRAQMLTTLASNRNDPANNALRALYRAVLPAGHPYRLPSFSEEETGIKAITRDDLLAFHRAYYSPHSLVLAVVGDVKITDVRALVEQYLGDWQGPAPVPLTFPPVPAQPATELITRIAEKSEAIICISHAATLRRASPDYYAAEVMNMILGGGGALNSRLGDVIRDRYGLAYTIDSQFHAATGAGPWYIELGVNPANVDKAVSLAKQVTTTFRAQGASQQEVDDAIAYITGTYAIELETNAALAGALQDAEYFQLGLDYPERVPRLYAAVTRAQVNAAAQRYLHPEQLTVSIAGTYGH